jgi:voltage-gated potassium channel
MASLMKPLIKIDPIRAQRFLLFLGQIAWRGRNILLILLAIIIIGGLLLSLFDGKSLAEGQYLAFITAMTIGYGDLAPVTWPARIVAVLIGINGLLFTGVIVAFTLKAIELTFREDIADIERVASRTETESTPEN